MGMTLLCLYGAVLFIVSRRAGPRGGDDQALSFFVGNRAGSASAVAFSLVVSCVGASATMGMAGQAFALGTPAFWWLGSGAVGLALLSLLLAKKVRQSGCHTLPEMVRQLVGHKAAMLVSLIVVAAWTAILAAQYAAASRLIGSMTGLSAPWCLAASFCLIVFHTMGGQAAVLRTDRVQFFIMAGGLLLLLYRLDLVNPGWHAVVRLEGVNEDFPPGELLRYAFVIGGNYLVCPMLFGRFFSAADPASARRGGLLAALGLTVASCLIVTVGLACRGLLPSATPRDAVLAAAVDAALPLWAALAVHLALVGAVVSSADSCLITAAAVLSRDLLRSHTRRVRLGSVALLGMSGLALAVTDRGILELLFMAYDIFVSGVVMPVFVMVMSKRKVRRTYLATLAIALGGILGLAAAVTAIPVLGYAGMGVSAVLTWRACRSSGW